jgi:YidC/Oxa1 family membrane protein insertase
MSKKKLDSTTVIVIIICATLLLSWNYIFGPRGLNWLPAPEPALKSQVSKNSDETELDKETTMPKAVSKTRTLITKPQAVQANTDNNLKLPKTADWNNKFSEIKLSSPESLYEITVNPVEGDISSVILKDFKNSAKTENVILDQNIIPGALSVSERNNQWKLLNVFKPIIDKEKRSVTVKREFSKADGTDFYLTQTWSLNKSYVINYTVSLSNPNSKSLKFQELNVWAGGIPPIQYLAGNLARSESHRIDVLLASNNSIVSIKSTDKQLNNDMIQYEPIKWLAVSNKYFACLLKPTDDNAVFSAGNINHRYMQKTLDENGKVAEYAVICAAGRIGSVEIQPNSKQTWDFEYYSGPKNVMLLKAFSPEATGIMHLAFAFLETISLWLLYGLIFLKGIVGSYGWAIILLTVIVKLVFWPITHKSNVSMKRMQKIQPLVKELREKYKDDKQKLNAKTMELYKKEKVNPLGGCLPILVQIPVFFALYWTLDGAIELRQASFLWINNLTMPDTVGHIFGLPINPLAIAMALTMVLQQKLTPTATDPAQAKMMMLMPVVMLFFLYSMPSGLTLYWTVSQLISIAQLLMNKYSGKKENLKIATT